MNLVGVSKNIPDNIHGDAVGIIMSDKILQNVVWPYLYTLKIKRPAHLSINERLGGD